MFGYIYLTINMINGKLYIGKKKSKKFLGNKYLGSGKILNQAIKKDGSENFVVALIESIYGNMEELNEAEKYYIELFDAVNSDLFYNIKPGGDGGRGTGWHHKESSKQKIKESNRISQTGKHHSGKTRKLMSESRTGEKHPMYGKHHSEKSKKQMSESAKNREQPPQCTSEGNPMKGKHWYNNGEISKPFLEDEVPEGWVKGRIIK